MASGFQNVLLVAYLLIVLAMIGVILLQRSEGGGLGMGSSSNNGLITVRGSANLLTRTTAILAALFFATAIGLTVLSELDRGSQSILDRAASSNGEQPATVLDALKGLSQPGTSDLPVPAPADTQTTPATPAADGTTTPATDAATTPAAPATTPAAPAADPGLAVPTTPADTAPAAPATPAAPAQ